MRIIQPKGKKVRRVRKVKIIPQRVRKVMIILPKERKDRKVKQVQTILQRVKKVRKVK